MIMDYEKPTLLAKFDSEVLIDGNGALVWKESNNVISDDITQLYYAYGLISFANIRQTNTAREIEAEEAFAAFADYRENMTDEQREEEEYERIAMAGIGESLMNPFTGKRFK